MARILAENPNLALQKDKRFIEERLAANRKQMDLMRIKFSELRRLEHEHFPTFQNLGQLRSRGQAGAVRKNGWFGKLGEVVESYRLNLATKRVIDAQATFLIGFRSSRSG